jgi:hypothetical protein
MSTKNNIKGSIKIVATPKRKKESGDRCRLP